MDGSTNCKCRTVEIRILVTAKSYDAAREKARKLADKAARKKSKKHWVTASSPTAVDRAGCLVGYCGRPESLREKQFGIG